MKNLGKKNIGAVITILLIVLFFSVVGNIVIAQTELKYVPLAPLPGIGEKIGDKTQITNLSQYIRGMVKLLIGVAAALAVIMVIIGGIEYMSTDAIGGKDDGKKKIREALWGLLLAICSWLILNTINPALIAGDLNLKTIPKDNVDWSEGLEEKEGYYKLKTCSSAPGERTEQTILGTFLVSTYGDAESAQNACINSQPRNCYFAQCPAEPTCPTMIINCAVPSQFNI